MSTEEVANTDAESITVQERKIIRQIEFYFGDANLPKDKFLQEKITEDDGWITLECLTTFNRLKQLTTDLDEIKAALKKSTSGLMEISGEDYKVRRSKDCPVPDADDPFVKKAKQMKTLYMKGFPLTYTFDDIEDFLAHNGASAVFIKLRRDNKGKFKGSVFVEISNQEEADKLLNNENLKCEDTVLKILLRENYFQGKLEERKQNRSDKKNDDNDTPSWKPGMVLHFKNTTDATTREDIKGVFNDHEPVSWIDFNKGETQGFIRFKEEGSAQKALDKMKEANDGKIVINENELEVRVIEGEEEENFWKMVASDDRKRNNNRNQRRNFKGKGRQRDFGKRKRPWEHKKENGSHNNKKQNEHKKFDSDDESVENKETVQSKDDNKVEEIESKKQKVENVEPKEQKAEATAE